MRDTIIKNLSLRSIMYLALVVTLISVLVLYIAFQARYLLIGPQIVLTENPVSIQEGRTVAIRGNAANIVALTLNDRPIFTNDAGDFTETLVLPDGYTIMTLKAKDRYGRETTLTKSFVHTPFF